MSFLKMIYTNTIIEAILADYPDFVMTIDDIQKATIREVLLYYAYTKIVNKGFECDFSDIPMVMDANHIEFTTNHDVLSVAYCLATTNRFNSTVSQETKDEIVQVAEEYNLLHDRKIGYMLYRLGIEINTARDSIKKTVLRYHGFGSNTKSARN